MAGTYRMAFLVFGLCCAAGWLISGCAPQQQAAARPGRIWVVDETDLAATAAAEARLRARAPEVTYAGVPLGEVVADLSERTGCNIHVNWTSLETVGVGRQSPVHAHLKDVTFATALQLILDEVGGIAALGYAIHDGVVVLSAFEDPSALTVTRIYDVRDLIAHPRPDLPTEALLREVIRGVLTPRQTGLFGECEDSHGILVDLYRAQIHELAAAIVDSYGGARARGLMDVIRAHVQPDAWAAHGGGPAVLTEVNGKLVTTQTRPAHRKIARLLSALREQTPTLPGHAASASQPSGPRVPPDPEAILPQRPAVSAPHKWPGGAATVLPEPVEILGVKTSRIYVAFLVDCSGSMLESFDQVRQDICVAIQALAEQQYFSLNCFGAKSRQSIFGGRLVRATRSNKEAALELLKRAPVMGMTHLLPALGKTIAALAPANGSASQEIFLVTDGAFADPKEIVDIVTQRYKRLKIPIHVLQVACQDEELQKPMRQIAEITSGTYRFVPME